MLAIANLLGAARSCLVPPAPLGHLAQLAPSLALRAGLIFSDVLQVVNPPHVRFYCGAPLVCATLPAPAPCRAGGPAQQVASVHPTCEFSLGSLPSSLPAPPGVKRGLHPGLPGCAGCQATHHPGRDRQPAVLLCRAGHPAAGEGQGGRQQCHVGWMPSGCPRHARGTCLQQLPAPLYRSVLWFWKVIRGVQPRRHC